MTGTRGWWLACLVWPGTGRRRASGWSRGPRPGTSGPTVGWWSTRWPHHETPLSSYRCNQVSRGEETCTNDVLTVTSTIPALDIKSVRKFRRMKTDHPETDRLRRHSVLWQSKIQQKHIYNQSFKKIAKYYDGQLLKEKLKPEKRFLLWSDNS